MIDDLIGATIGEAILRIVLYPFHLLVWCTGVLVASAGSFGRFQIQPFADDGEWEPEDERPILYTGGATMIGIGVWIIILAAIYWERVI